MSAATRAEVCAVACAEAYRGNGEVIASAFGTIPAIGVRLARHTFEPDLVVSDGEAAAGIYNKEMLRKCRVRAQPSMASWPENARKTSVPGEVRVT